MVYVFKYEYRMYVYPTLISMLPWIMSPLWIVSSFVLQTQYIKRANYSNFFTFEITNLVKFPRILIKEMR